MSKTTVRSRSDGVLVIRDATNKVLCRISPEQIKAWPAMLEALRAVSAIPPIGHGDDIDFAEAFETALHLARAAIAAAEPEGK